MGATVSNVLEKIVPMLLVIVSSSSVFIRLGDYDGTPHGGVPSEAGMWYH